MKKLNENTKVTLSISQLKRLIRESLILEDKTRLINRLTLPDISDEYEKEKYKTLLIDFFKTHSNYENKIDWNKAKTLTKKDFDSVIQSAETSKSNIKRQEKIEIEADPKNIFRSEGDKKFKVVYENDNWLFVSPLSYEAAKFCDGSINQGAGAKWCIGYEKDDSYWIDYIKNGSLFIMAFNKDYKNLSDNEKQTKMKFMIQLDEDNEIHIWNQRDKDIGSNVKRFGISVDQVEQMFASVKHDFAIAKRDNYKNTYGEPIEVGEDSFIFCKDGVLTKYDGDATNIVIPEGVTSIGYMVFYGYDRLTSVIIPEGVTSIEGGAFLNCVNLKSVTIPEGVMSIGDFAFDGCHSLTSVTIPATVKEIGDNAFEFCTSLTSVTILEGVKSIGSYAFYGCTGLTSVMIPNSVKSIGEEAFSECKKFTKIKAPWVLIKKYVNAFKGSPIYKQIREKLKQNLKKKDA